jgi:hypothetical protein
MHRTSHVLGTLLLCTMVAVGCATSRATAPSQATPLPRFQFVALQRAPVQLVVLDHRADAVQTEAWVRLLASDISRSLSSAGITVSPAATTVLEVRIHHLRADFENRQWKGCAKLTAALSKPERKVEAVGERCTTKSNLWGAATADNVMKLAYQDALAELLSSLDSQLR